MKLSPLTMTLFPTVIATAISLLAIVLPSHAQTNDESQNQEPKKRSIFLKGSIQHSTKVEPLDSSIQAGALVNAVALKKLTPNNVWYKIPNWLAGNWKMTHTTTFFRKDLVSGSESFDTSLRAFKLDTSGGLQVDSKGGIWDLAGHGGTNLGTGDDYLNYQYIRTVDPISVTDKQVVLRYFGTMVYVNRSTNRIAIAEQVESLNTYTRVSDTVVKVVSSNKVFDRDGVEESLYKNLSYKSRASNFSPLNQVGSTNLRSMFCEYLDSHGMSNLKPPN